MEKAMLFAKPISLVRLEYANAAAAYLRSLPPEHFMEAIPQATQREITVESLALVKAQLADLHYFNELLLQYPLGPRRRIRQVVPDNMVVRHEGEVVADGSYDVPLQPARPFWVMEYVSKSSQRKDYEDSFEKYERELRVPYYLLFYPDVQELTLFKLAGRKYRATLPNGAGRYPIPELELEVGLLGGWARYWFRGELVPLPAELLRKLQQAQEQLRESQEQARLAQEQARLAQEQARLSREQAEQAQEQARLSREQAEQAQEQARKVEAQVARERKEKERLRARLRELGVEL